MSNAAMKIRAYPTPVQEKDLMQAFGNARFVWNNSLAERIRIYQLTGQTALSKGQQAGLVILKKKYPFLALSPAVTLQQKLRDLDKAYTNFFAGRAAFPKFRKKNGHQSVRFTNQHNYTAIRREGDCITIPRIGAVRCAFSRPVVGTITSATVSMDPDGKFHISLTLELPDNLLVRPKTGLEAGVDLGIKDLAVLSDGTKYENHKYLKQSEEKLARAQRELSGKKGARKGEKQSNNYKKQKRKVARLHKKVANQRKDAIHKMTHDLTETYDLLVIEDLNASGMAKNHSLARAVSDASFCEIRRQIEYKSVRTGTTVVIVGRFYPSSQLCSACGTRNPAVRNLAVREWDCPVCGAHHDRDVNAARNLLAEGKRLLANTP